MTWGDAARIFGAGLALAGIAVTVSAWNGEDPVFAHPEAAVLLMLAGGLVLHSGASAALSIVLRAIACLGFAHLFLTFLGLAGATEFSSRLATTPLTALTFLVASAIAWIALPRCFTARRDAILFVTAAALVTAIAVRDTLGPSFSPYIIDDAGFWALASVGLALTALEGFSLLARDARKAGA